MKHNFGNGVKLRLKGYLLKHMHGMITCREFEDFVIDYLDGQLSERHRRVFEMHIRLCRECREYLTAYQQSIEAGRAVFSASDDPVPDDVPEDLINAILKANAG